MMEVKGKKLTFSTFAKKYGTDTSSSFVNGVLAKLA